METGIEVYRYKDHEIEFDLSNENLMVNATEMAKIFDVKIYNFLRNSSTKKFIDTIKLPHFRGNLNIKLEDDIIKTTGRNGTWMHRVLALKFAAWLDPQFELWVYTTIDKLLYAKNAYKKPLLKLNQPNFILPKTLEYTGNKHVKELSFILREIVEEISHMSGMTKGMISCNLYDQMYRDTGINVRIYQANYNESFVRTAERLGILHLYVIEAYNVHCRYCQQFDLKKRMNPL